MEGDTHVTRIQSYALGEWVTGSGAGTPLHDAVTGEQIADASSDGLDFAAMLDHGRASGGTRCGASPSTSAPAC
jgi:oxepin-CoA hydrolase/3-oxo-5,6-dehydrosuberyl-CoA semialdehyde dehydrogenase